MAKRPDEQQPLAGALDLRSESSQVHAVGDDCDVGPLSEQRAILLRHDHHFADSADPFRLESPPAPIVPALGEAGRAVANLPVQAQT